MPLKLTKRAGSPYWYLRGTVRGARIFESTGIMFREKGAAEEALTVRTHELLQASIHGQSAVRTFSDAAVSYMSAGGDRTHLEPIIRYFGRAKLSAIGQHEIEAAANKLKPKGAPATVNRHIYTPIAAVLHHAARKKWCDSPVIARPKEPKGRVRWISYEEADRLIEAAAPHIRPLVIVLLTTGARLSEALYLDWRQVDLNRAHISFLNLEGGGVGTKNGESRGVPLHPRAVAALANLPHRTGPVFRRSLTRIRKDGTETPLGGGYASRGGQGGGQIKTAWAAMLRRSGITDFTPHDCRHTWATWHYTANRDISALMELGGWKSPEMVMRYAHVNVSHLANTVNRLWSGAELEQGDSDETVKPFPLKA